MPDRRLNAWSGVPAGCGARRCRWSPVVRRPSSVLKLAPNRRAPRISTSVVEISPRSMAACEMWVIELVSSDHACCLSGATAVAGREQQERRSR